jgi:uncharacterized RDD family membrane protein YckC
MSPLESVEESIFPEADIKFAAFWPRLGAMFLDGLILAIITLPVTYLNITLWKIPYLFILTSLPAIIYKPFMEYQYGATLGKMALGLKVVGHSYEKVTLNEELRRVSFYLVPGILQQILTAGVYFSSGFRSISNYQEFNQEIVRSNPSINWLNIIVSILLVADCIAFFSSNQRRSLHDIYAGTYVIESPRN